MVISLAQLKAYANFNTVTFQGRVSNVDVVDGQYCEFLAITVLTNVADDETVSVVFNDSSKGMMSLYTKGWLPVGRQVTIVGHLAGVSETYFDKKSGQTMLRKRPQITLKDVSIPTGGLGPMPADKAPATAPKRGMVVAGAKQAPVDESPAVEPQAPKPYGSNTSVDQNGFPVL